jgi:hypothetical protein
MKKIGILFGMEDTFPQAFIDRVNSKRKDIIAEAVSIDMVVQNKDGDYGDYRPDFRTFLFTELT